MSPENHTRLFSRSQARTLWQSGPRLKRGLIVACPPSSSCFKEQLSIETISCKQLPGDYSSDWYKLLQGQTRQVSANVSIVQWNKGGTKVEQRVAQSFTSPTLTFNQSIHQISITPIYPAQPCSLMQQPNQCSRSKSIKQLHNINRPLGVLVSTGERPKQRDVS